MDGNEKEKKRNMQNIRLEELVISLNNGLSRYELHNIRRLISLRVLIQLVDAQ